MVHDDFVRRLLDVGATSLQLVPGRDKAHTWLQPECESLVTELEHSLCSRLLPSSVICHLVLGEGTESLPLRRLPRGSASAGLCFGDLL